MARTVGSESISKLERQEAFLKVFPTAGTITAGASAIGITRATVQEWIRNDPVFAKKFEESRQGFVEQLENIAFDLVKEMASNRDYKANPTLLIFMLNGNAPHKYRGLVETPSEARDLLGELRALASSAPKKEKKSANTAAKETVLKYEDEKKAFEERLGNLKNGGEN